ncbi:MAG: hypothetical protein ACOCX2_04290 [Armatimonadota bacterium]
MVKSSEWLSGGWALIKPYLGTHVLIALVAGLLSSVTLGILSGPLTCGWFMILLRQRREPSYEPQFSDLWKGFEVFAQSFVAWLIIAIVLAVASALVGVAAAIVEAVPVIGQLLAPMTGAIMAICAMVVFFYVFPLIAERRADALEAIKRSAETTTPEFVPFAGFALILYILHVIGAALCGIGLLITGPVTMAAIAVSYDDVLGGGAAPAAPQPPEPTAEQDAPQ